MQPAKLVLHRSGFAWPIMFDLIYIYILMLYVISYIYIYVENTWKIYECRWTCDICSSAVFSHTFALGLGMFYFEA